MGSPTLIAKFSLPGNTSQVAARLLDVDPSGQEMLIARGLWRPKTGTKTQVFQLHPNGWHFDEGHIARLQLLPDDSGNTAIGGYGRASNDQQDVTVSKLDLRLPVLEKPGSTSAVDGHAPRLLPNGYKLAPDFKHDPAVALAGKKLTAHGPTVKGKVECPSQWAKCSHGKVVLKSRGTHKKGAGFKVATGKFKKIKGGKTKMVKLKLTGKARKYLADHSKVKVTAKITAAEAPDPTKQNAKIAG
jgi:hypothetical protein